MNSKLQMHTLGAVLLLVLTLTAAPAQPVPPRPPANPPAPAAPAIDPSTGLPVAPTPPPWIDPNWADPNLVVTNLTYDGLPISEVARDLRERFKDYFDILPMPSTFGRDWGGEIIVKLQLRHVGASEIFNAMNLIFENDQTPVRWELKAGDGANRKLVLLRVLPEAAPAAQAQGKPADAHRMVYFVGNLIGDEKSGGMTMEQIIKTIAEVWPQEFGKPEEVIQFHKDAQLLVINGARDQNEFIHQTLAALELKVQLEKNNRISADLKSRMDGFNNQKPNGSDTK